MGKKKIIAAFDFDGTITKKDTLFDFIIYYRGVIHFLIGLIILSPLLILFKLGFIKNAVAKEKVFSYFFRNESVDRFNNVCKSYSHRISEMCRQDILKKIKWHNEQDHTVVIISASVVNWIEPWALKNGIDKVIGTEISIIKGLIDGRFGTPNCYGQEKVNRLLAAFPDRNDYTLYAYGDSRGDKELLDFSDYPCFIN